jgi:hypothetical protein
MCLRKEWGERLAVNFRDEASLLCSDLGMKPGSLANSDEWTVVRMKSEMYRKFI